MGLSAKQLQALRRSLNRQYVRSAKPMGASSPISKAGMRSQKPIGSLALMPGTGRPWSPVASWRAKTAGHSSPSMSPRCASPCMPMAQLSSVTAMGRGKAVAPPQGTSTTSPSRPQKPMPPNERSPPSANRLGLSFIARIKAHRCKLCRRTSRPQQVHPRSPVWAHTLTIRHRSRGHPIIMDGDTRTR